MKPDWKDAPDWANYLARDDDGCWNWFQFEPYCWGTYWRSSKGEVCVASDVAHWTETLEQRPST